jgi:hypothetical protein
MRRSFQMRDFRVLHGPQQGTQADTSATGVSSPSDLRPDVHRTIPYTAPDAYGVCVGLGMLFSEGLTADNCAARVDVKMGDGSWAEYDPDVDIEMSRQHHQHPTTRRRRERRQVAPG